jgi:uncharacterized protein (PEP-CTERM system associated)
VHYEVVPDQVFEQGLAEIQYPAASVTKLIARGIYENYSIPGEDPEEGPGWLIGIGWTPSARTTLQIMGGERFFGPAYFVNFSHQSRWANWTVDCNQVVTTTQMLVTGTASIPLEDSAGNPILNEEGFPVEIALPVTTIVPQTFLTKGCVAGVSVSTAKSRVFATVSAEKRDYREAEGDQKIGAVQAGWTWRFYDRTQFLMNGRYFRQELSETEQTDDAWQIDVGVTRDLARYAEGFFGLRHLDRSSTTPGGGYLVNYASLGVTFRF